MKNVALMTNQCMTYKQRLEEKILKLLAKKEDGGKEIIIELLLVGVAIGLAIAWKTGIGSTITSMISEFTTKISGLFS